MENNFLMVSNNDNYDQTKINVQWHCGLTNNQLTVHTHTCTFFPIGPLKPIFPGGPSSPFTPLSPRGPGLPLRPFFPCNRINNIQQASMSTTQLSCVPVYSTTLYTCSSILHLQLVPVVPACRLDQSILSRPNHKNRQTN